MKRLTTYREAMARIKELEGILDRAVDWWLGEGMQYHPGAPEWVFAAREALGDWEEGDWFQEKPPRTEE